MMKTYQCPYCVYVTSRIYNLKRHNKSVHKANVEASSSQGHHMTYHCPYCQYATKRAYNFKRHCQSVHKKIIDPHNSDNGSLENMNLQSLDKECCEERQRIKKPIVITSTGSTFLLE